ncbi:aldose 1-epimerase [Cohnella hongkongensis]|uniref:Aldose 1-epimerase n=1 Tax=Cohnella hongkongensis TaxID=178337 RepID=A0ABV9FEW0_9BACL
MPPDNEHEARETDFLGLPAVRLENEHLIAVVAPGWGSRVVSLRSREAETELLRIPASLDEYEEAPMLFGVPVLFPPNRIEDGKFSFGGSAYRFDRNDAATGCHAHGLVHDKPWETVSLRRDEREAVLVTELVSSRYPEVTRQFPPPFRLTMTLALKGSVLTQTVEILNESGIVFPWGLGYHTTFRFPFGDRAEAESCLFSATVGRRWQLNERLLPTGRLENDPRCGPLREGMPLKGVLLDDVFQAAGEGRNEAVLTDREAGLRVTYRTDETFRHWVLHNGDGQGGYLCPEPYTCVTNAFNLPLGPDVTGLQTLRPGERRTVSCEIEVEWAPRGEGASR